MPLVRTGGEADKLGNYYELMWRLRLLMELISGHSEALVLEAFDPTRSAGVDAEVQRRKGDRFVTEFHSVKRQHSSGEWTPTSLFKDDDRSPARHLVRKIEANLSSHIGRFISTSPVRQVPSLCDAAIRSRDANEFLIRISNGSDKDRREFSALLDNIQVWLKVDIEKAHRILERLSFRCPSEDELEENVRFEISRELMRTDGSEVDVEAVANVLSDYMRRNLGPKITRQSVLEHLDQLGYHPKNLGGVRIAVEEVYRQNQRFQNDAEERLIQGRRLPRKEADLIAAQLKRQGRAWVMVTGDAGSGKSCVLAQVVAQLGQSNIPTLAFRMDTASPARSLNELQQFLDLHWAPVSLLDGIAQRRQSVLVIDQVDALSMVSGRRNAQQWNVIRGLLVEAKKCPGMSIVLACRTFDLEYDNEIKTLLEDRAQKCERVAIGLLPSELVRDLIGTSGASINQWTEAQVDLLRVPLHLELFLRCSAINPRPAHSLTELYRRYLSRLRELTLSCTPQWEIDLSLRLAVECFSEHQAVALDWAAVVSQGIESHMTRLVTEGVLLLQGTGEHRLFRFFHDTFFDFSFAEFFVRGQQSLIDLLTSEGERQELFRRTQCRQVLRFLRQGSPAERVQYLCQLSELLLSPKVRAHIKFFILAWLNAQEDPTEEEWRIVHRMAKPVKWSYHAYRIAVWGKVSWFDLLFRLGQWERWLVLGNKQMSSGVAWILGQKEIMQHRSREVVAILRGIEHKCSRGRWRELASTVLASGEFCYSEESFDLFLRALEEDWRQLRERDHWESSLRRIPGVSGAWATKVLTVLLLKKTWAMPEGTIFFRHQWPIRWQIEAREWGEKCERQKWARMSSARHRRGFFPWVSTRFQQLKEICLLGRVVDKAKTKENWFSGLWSRLIRGCRKRIVPTQYRDNNVMEFLLECSRRAPVEYVELCCQFAEALMGVRHRDKVCRFAEVWCLYGRRADDLSGIFYSSLQNSLKELARSSPQLGGRCINRLLRTQLGGVEILAMSTWAENGSFFAEQGLKFLKADVARLFYQPAAYSGGNADAYFGRVLVKSIAPHLTNRQFEELEELIIGYKAGGNLAQYKSRFAYFYNREWDVKRSDDRQVMLTWWRRRDRFQFILLSMLPGERLTGRARKKISAWTLEFGAPDHSPPTGVTASFVGSPIELSEIEKMTDNQLLEAIKKYDSKAAPERPFEWSSDGLRGELKGLASRQKQRFYKLLDRLDSSFDFQYTCSIVSGLFEQVAGDPKVADAEQLLDSQVTDILNRFGTTDNEGLAKTICWGIEGRMSLGPLKEQWVRVLIWFAVNHNDPSSPADDWSCHSGGATGSSIGDDLLTSGINHVRGVACYSLAKVLFRERQYVSIVRDFLPSFIADKSLGVRVVTIEILIAWLNSNRNEAVAWFVEMSRDNDIVLQSPVAEHFIAWACGSHLEMLGPIIDHMRDQMSGEAKSYGIRQSVRCALNVSSWERKVNVLLNDRSPKSRIEVAEIAAASWSNPQHRLLAEEWLKRCFADKDEGVRDRAAGVFRHVKKDDWQSILPLGAVFLDSVAFFDGVDELINCLERACPLPTALALDVVARIVCAWRKGDQSRKLEKFRWRGYDLSKVLLMAYNSTSVDQQRSLALNILDSLLVEGLYQIGELNKDTETPADGPMS